MRDSGKGQWESFGLIKRITGTKLSKTGRLFCLVILVCGAVAAVYWPVLEAKSLSFRAFFQASIAREVVSLISLTNSAGNRR